MGKRMRAHAKRKSAGWLETGAAAHFAPPSEREEYRNRGNTFGAASEVRRPPAMQALVDITKLNPKPGDHGMIKCPGCDAETFGWYYEKVIGKLSGKCSTCGLKLPRG